MSYINARMVSALAVMCCVMAVAGCSKTESSSSSSASPTAAPGGPSLSQELGVDLPTQEEADAKAAAAINSQNADEAFAQLEREAAEEP